MTEQPNIPSSPWPSSLKGFLIGGLLAPVLTLLLPRLVLLLPGPPNPMFSVACLRALMATGRAIFRLFAHTQPQAGDTLSKSLWLRFC